MNSFLAIAFLAIAALGHFNALSFGKDQVAITLFCLAMAAIMFVKADVKELIKLTERTQDVAKHNNKSRSRK